jgi:D-proline reductase (dithiol) PrdB
MPGSGKKGRWQVPTDLKGLVTQIVESGTARTPLSRLNFLRNVATEDELAELFGQLFIQAAEAKHKNEWDGLVQFLEEWEDRTLARVAAGGTFPELAAIPWTPLRAPVRKARIALMTSGGLYVDDQEPFVTTNDPTYREIPRGTPQRRIRVSHRGYDVQGPLADMNCLLPLTRLEELEAEGVVGSLAPTSYSFNGSIPDVSHLQEWPHEVAARMRQEDVDAVLLTPA